MYLPVGGRIDHSRFHIGTGIYSTGDPPLHMPLPQNLQEYTYKMICSTVTCPLRFHIEKYIFRAIFLDLNQNQLFTKLPLYKNTLFLCFDFF